MSNWFYNGAGPQVRAHRINLHNTHTKYKADKNNQREKASMKLLPLEAVAETLAVSRQTIQRMIDTGALPAICVRSGRRKKLWRVRPEQLQQWLLQKERENSKGAKSE